MRKPTNWKSLKTGNEFPHSRYTTYETDRNGWLALPKDQYPYTLLFEYLEPKWKTAS